MTVIENARQIGSATTEHTIGRSYVHRSALSEVFLTGLEPEGADAYRACAQFPRSHAYYGDRLCRPASYDPVLVLEFARQAALSGAHAFYGVPFTSKFILTHQRLTILRPSALAIGDNPVEVTAAVTTANLKTYDGAVSGLDYTMEVFFGDVPIGHSGIGLRFRDPEGYQGLRLKNREGRAPQDSRRLSPRRRGIPVDPYLVGRRDPENVILVDAETAGNGASARLSAPGGHPSLFDHPQDHLPGMVLIEGARQLAVLAVGEVLGLAPTKLPILFVGAEYLRFAELEPDTELEAVICAPTGGPVGDVIEVAVEVKQNGESVARIGLTVGRAET